MLAILLGSSPATARAMNIAREASSLWGEIRGVSARHRACSKSEEMGLAEVAEPSEADVTATPQLQVALNTVVIRGLSEQDFVSLSERRMMG